jgi:hypothetical protein
LHLQRLVASRYPFFVPRVGGGNIRLRGHGVWRRRVQVSAVVSPVAVDDPSEESTRAFLETAPSSERPWTISAAGGWSYRHEGP